MERKELLEMNIKYKTVAVFQFDFKLYFLVVFFVAFFFSSFSVCVTVFPLIRKVF